MQQQQQGPQIDLKNTTSLKILMEQPGILFKQGVLLWWNSF